MQQGGMDDVTRMEGLEDINAGTNARSGPDAAANKKEVANQAVAALSRRCAIVHSTWCYRFNND